MYCTLREYISINETFRLYDFGVAGHTVTEMGVHLFLNMNTLRTKAIP